MEGREMSEHFTETDGLWNTLHTGNRQPSWWVVAEKMRDLCRKMESERNEAREKYTTLLTENMLAVNRLYKERDEARNALADWENAAAHVEADHPDEKHCGCVPVLRKLLTDARESARRWRKVASAYEILTPPVGGKRIMKLAHRDGWQCAYCGVETCFTGKDGPKATVDHVVPKSKGGLDHLSNCVVACEECNGAKADQEDWSPPEVDEPKSEGATWVWEDGKFRKKK